MKIDVSQIKAGLSRESNTLGTVAARDGKGEFKRPGWSHKEIVSPSTSGFSSGLEFTCRARAQARPRTPPRASFTSRVDLQISRRGWPVSSSFFQSDGAVKRLLRSSKRPFFAFTLVSRVYGSHDPDAADLRGHHDDLHGTDAAYQACRFGSG